MNKGAGHWRPGTSVIWNPHPDPGEERASVFGRSPFWLQRFAASHCSPIRTRVHRRGHGLELTTGLPWRVMSTPRPERAVNELGEVFLARNAVGGHRKIIAIR